MANSPVQFDFYNPVMQAYISDAKDNRFNLWMDIGDKVGEAYKKSAAKHIQSFPYVSEIRSEMDLARVPSIRVTLTPPFKEGLDFLSEDQPFSEWATNFITVKLGYVPPTPSNADLAFTHEMTGVLLTPSIQLGTDMTITLNGQGVGGFTAQRLTSTESAAPNSTRRQVCYFLWAQLNKGLPDKGKIDIEFSLDANSRMGKFKEPAFTSGGKTIMQSLWELAWKSGCTFSFTTNKAGKPTIFFQAKVETTSAPGVCRLSFFDFAGGELGPFVNPPTYPILNVSSPTMGAYLPTALLGLGLKVRDEKGEFVTVKPDSNALKGTGSGNTNAPPCAVLPRASEQIMKPAAADTKLDAATVAEVKAKIQAQFDSSRAGIGIALDIETLGIPTIQPGMIVNVTGIGNRLSGENRGNYTVMRVVHVYNNSGFTTNLELISNTGLFAIEDPICADIKIPQADLNHQPATPPLTTVQARRVDA